jgi:anti-sigma regulatory factor (Ser/Thr protein kinase)
MRDSTTQARDFDPDTAEIRRAREFVVTAAADGADATELADRLALVVSELASNAVLHAGTPFTVRVRRGHDVVRVEVVDRSAGQPAPRPLDPTAVSGRGLAIVDSLASSWGVEPSGSGKCVWAELPLHLDATHVDPV